MKVDKYGSPEILNKLSIIVFVAIIITIVMFFFAAHYLIEYNTKNKITAKYINTIIPTALEAYKLDMGSYPSTSQGLDALWRTPIGLENYWNGPYMTPTKDAWGGDFQYVYPALFSDKPYDIWSLGRDISKESDDITNWNNKARKNNEKN